MTANEIMTDIIGEDYLAENGSWTADTCKFGNAERSVKKIGVCLTATPKVLESAKEWGADLLIVHEPTFYTHNDKKLELPITKLKEKAVEQCGAVIFRYHDSMHFRKWDRVSKAFLDRLGWRGEFDGALTYTHDSDISVAEAGRQIKEVFSIPQIKLVGRTDTSARKIILLLGQRGEGDFDAFMADDEARLAVCGEVCEWRCCEYIRDAAQFGKEKSLLIMGHADSEKFAMLALATEIDGKYDGAAARCFDCGELCSYI